MYIDKYMNRFMNRLQHIKQHFQAAPTSAPSQRTIPISQQSTNDTHKNIKKSSSSYQLFNNNTSSPSTVSTRPSTTRNNMPGSQYVPDNLPKGNKPIQLYSLATPNGIKVAIMLEELGLEYDAHTINIGKNEQFQDWFLAIAPNNRIPAIVDLKGPDGKGPFPLFESGAILQYFADIYDKEHRLLSTEPRKRYETLQWVNWQMGGLGPMLGQMGHFWKYAVQKGHDVPYAKQRYLDEAKRLFGVLDKQLEGQEYIVGTYSIADIIVYGWAIAPTKFYSSETDVGKEFQQFKNVHAWLERMRQKPAVQKGEKVTPFP